MVYYSDTISQMKHWLPQLEILPAGLSEAERAELADYNVSIASIHAIVPHLLCSSGVIRGEKTGNRSMVDYLVEYRRDRCAPAGSTDRVELTPPEGLVRHRCGLLLS